MILYCPEGADIYFLYSPDEEALKAVSFPENGNFVVHTAQWENLDLSDAFHVVYEFPEYFMTEKIWFSSLETARTYFGTYTEYRMPFDQCYLWLLDNANEGLEPGKYCINEGENGAFTLEYLNGTDKWGQPYVCFVDQVYFYTFEDAIAYIKAYAVGQSIHVAGDVMLTEVVQVPIAVGGYRISFDYNNVSVRFSRGAVYDDGKGGLCYYSDLTRLLSIGGLEGIKEGKDKYNTYVYIQSTEEDLLPGKYLIDVNNGGEEYNEDDWMTVYSSGGYTITWIEPLAD